MRKRAVCCLVLAVLGVLFLAARQVIGVRTLLCDYDGVSVRMADAPIPAKKLRRLLAEESDGLTCTAAWARGAKVSAAAPAMQTTARLRVIPVYGDMRQISPMTLLSGSFPAGDDTEGCALDARSAETLFHSVDVVNAKITISGATYLVRGVVSGGEPMALVRDPDGAFTNLEFFASDVAAGKAMTDAFLYRYALSSDYAVVQSGLYARILFGLSFLPAVVTLLFATISFLRAAFHPRGKKRFAVLPLLVALVCGALAVLLLRDTFLWPQAFLPTKCADFGFWKTLWSGWRETWESINLLPSPPKDIQFFRAMRIGVFRIFCMLLLEAYACASMAALRAGVSTNRKESSL